MTALRTKRAALRKTQKKLEGMTGKLVTLMEKAKEEEALRAVVPAGSGR